MIRKTFTHLTNNNKLIAYHRHTLLLTLFLILTSSLFAQPVAEYGFEAYRGKFIELAGASSSNFQGTFDEGALQSIPIGFNFTYEDNSYNTLSASTNGFVRLGAGDLDLNGTQYYNNELSSDTYASGAILAPLWDDLEVGGISFLTTGSAPDRVFTVQWLNVKWSKAQGVPTISFQLKLYEGKNSIEFIYNRVGNSAVSWRSASIGIAGAGTGPNTFLALEGSGFSSVIATSPLPDVGASSEFKSIQALPLSDQVYKFGLDLKPELIVDYVDHNSASLRWGYGTTNVAYTLEEKIGENGTFTPVYSTSTSHYYERKNLPFETKVYYRLKRGNYYSDEELVFAHSFGKYGFEAHSAPFIQLTGAKQVEPFTADPTLVIDMRGSNSIFYDIPVGFEFPFAGTTYSKVHAAFGGLYLTQNPSGIPMSNGNLSSYLPARMIFPFYSPSVGAKTVDYKISYKTEGYAPNRICTIEWLDLNYDYNNQLPPTLSVQVRLFESTGKIEFHYANGAGDPKGNQAQIGIKSNGTYANTNNLLGVKSATPSPDLSIGGNIIEYIPLSGQVYSFEYNATPAAPRINQITGSSVELIWAAPYAKINYVIEQKKRSGL